MAKTDILKVKVITHYYTEDEDFSGDYSSITILVNGKEAVQYGDSYHDKGREKSEGFIEGLTYIYKGTVEVNSEEIADSEY